MRVKVFVGGCEYDYMVDVSWKHKATLDGMRCDLHLNIWGACPIKAHGRWFVVERHVADCERHVIDCVHERRMLQL